MSSTTGTSNTGKKLGFKAKEICEILKMCAESGVKTLKIGDLEASFEDPPTKIVQEVPTADFRPDIVRLEHHNEVADDFEEAQMLIDDPDGFEESQIKAAYEQLARDNS